MTGGVTTADDDDDEEDEEEEEEDDCPAPVPPPTPSPTPSGVWLSRCRRAYTSCRTVSTFWNISTPTPRKYSASLP